MTGRGFRVTRCHGAPLPTPVSVAGVALGYLDKDEDSGGLPNLRLDPPRRAARPSDGTQARRRGFTFGGHRLPSLYRASEHSVSKLTFPYRPPASSL